jgi:ketosteroid isomerase-like protein
MRTSPALLVGAISLLLLGFGGAVIAGDDETAATDQASATAANEAAYLDAFVAKDLDAFMATFSDDPIFEDRTFGDYLVGAVAVRDMENAVLRMTDHEVSTLLDHFVSADGARAVQIWQWAGTNYLGRPFDMPILVVHEYQDGKIAKESLYYAAGDAYAQLTQSAVDG